MAKLEKNPNAIIEKSSIGMNIVERAKAPTETVNPMDTAVTINPMMMGPRMAPIPSIASPVISTALSGIRS